MTYNALRVGRVSLRGQLYLITAVTFRREPLFEDFHLARHVVTALRSRDRAGETCTLAFVVMPDHVHWLFELTSKISLGRIMKRFKGGTARQINVMRGRTGAVWQPSFHDHALRAEECIASAARYVIMNPVRAALVECIGAYPHWDVAWEISSLGVVEQDGRTGRWRSGFNPTRGWSE